MTAASATGNLAQLQDRIKRDPEGYKDEFKLQFQHFKSALEIFSLDPTTQSKEFLGQVSFMSHVAPFFRDEVKDFPGQICGLLEASGPALHPNARMTFVRALLLLRNKELISPTILLPLLFRLMSCPDKSLRNILRSHVVNDIKKSNKKKKDQKLNTAVMAFLRKLIADPKEMHASRHALGVVIELYRRGIWTDAKAVNIIAQGLLHDDTKIRVMAIQFFLTDKEVNGEEEEETAPVKLNEVYKEYGLRHKKKTKKRKRVLEKALAKAKKQTIAQKKMIAPNFPALQLIHDPQGLAEKMFGKLKNCVERFEVKLMMMSLISRLIATHELLLLNFYPWMLRYVQPHQEMVTAILAYLAQACHIVVPPETLRPIHKAIADRFVSDRSTPAVMTVGLNCIREICTRNPSSLEPELLHDLIQYKSYRDKGVSLGAKSLLSLYRTVDPSMLQKKDRGRSEDIAAVPYGKTQTVDPMNMIKELRRAKETLKHDDDDDDDDDDESDEEARSKKKRKIFKEPRFEEQEEEEEVGYGYWDKDGNFVKMEVSDDDEETTEREFKHKEEEEEVEEEEEEKEEDSQRDLEGLEEDQSSEEDEAADHWIEDADESNTESDSEEDVGEKVDEEKDEKEGDISEEQLSLSEIKILTDEDYELLKEARAMQKESGAGKKRKGDEDISEDDSENEGPNNFVDESAILSHVKRRKNTYEDRVASVVAGRENRGEYGAKRGKERSSKTNREKQKNQPFQLVKHSSKIRNKKRRSAKEAFMIRRKHAKYSKSYFDQH